MRDNLAEYRGARITVIGCFDHFGFRLDNGRRVETALFQAVETPEGEFLCEHCHVQFADTMRAYDLRHGEKVQFLATVMSYKRRLSNCNENGTMYEVDYGLYHPTGIKPLNREVFLPSLVNESAPVRADARMAVKTIGHQLGACAEELEAVDEQNAPIATKDAAAPTPPAAIPQPVSTRTRAKRIDLLNELQRLAEIHGGFPVVQRGLDLLNDEQDPAR